MSAQPAHPARQLGPLADLDGGDLLAGDPHRADDVGVEDPHPVLADGSHGQLRLKRHAELAHHEHIQRRAQRRSDLGGDGNPAAGHTEHDHRLRPQVLQSTGQAPPGISAISEHHGRPLPWQRHHRAPCPQAPESTIPTSSCSAGDLTPRARVAIPPGRPATPSVTEISAHSSESFEDAIRTGIARATKTLRGVTSAWVKEQQVKVQDNQVTEYRVNLLASFVLE